MWNLHGKIYKKNCKNNKWIDKFVLIDDSSSVSTFKIILITVSINKKVTDNSPIRIYVNKIGLQLKLKQSVI